MIALPGAGMRKIVTKFLVKVPTWHTLGESEVNPENPQSEQSAARFELAFLLTTNSPYVSLNVYALISAFSL